MPTRIISKDLLKEIAPDNKVWLEKFRAESPDYYTNVQEFLEFCACRNDNVISNIDRIELDSYVNLYISTLQDGGARPNTINRRLSALSGFRNFLHSNYSDTFDEKFLSSLPKHEYIDENPTDIKALDLVQLSCARKYNHRSVKDEYISSYLTVW